MPSFPRSFTTPVADVRLLMVDPKIVELKMFNVLPHMLIPVVTEARRCPPRSSGC